jgi:hypothetical protein
MSEERNDSRTEQWETRLKRRNADGRGKNRDGRGYFGKSAPDTGEKFILLKKPLGTP